MTITLVSSYLNHHQLMLCKALMKRCDKFFYISTGRIPKERLEFGYKELDYEYDFVIRTYDGSATRDEIGKILIESDAVIFGSCPSGFIEYRMNHNKLSFLFSERFFKKGVWRRFYPPTRKKVVDRIIKFRKKNIYVLCASAFIVWELSLLGFPSDKCYKWGYFPQVEFSEDNSERKGDKLHILWAGRMLGLKRVDMSIKACRKLYKSGIDFQLDLIGEGEEMDKLKALCRKYNLSDKVRFLGSMSPEDVKKAMRQSDVFLFTSNHREGWGAVLNEAMSCGCAVIASSSIGSVPFLIEDGKNGLIYKYSSQKDLDKKLLSLANDNSLRKKLGENAVETIKNIFSPELAAERFMDFVKSANKDEVYFKSGPMSRAEIIKNRWYKN